jgi:CheY-like chemotaxis protein
LNYLFRIIEIFSLLTATCLGIYWYLNPDSNTEPIIVSLLLVSALIELRTKSIKTLLRTKKSRTSTASKKILFVDDDKYLLEDFSFLMGTENIDCLTARSTQKAIELLRDNSDISIMVCDLMMPKANSSELESYYATKLPVGVALAKFAHDKYPGLEIIGCSAMSYRDDANAWFRNVGSGFISKPFDANQITEISRFFIKSSK